MFPQRPTTYNENFTIRVPSKLHFPSCCVTGHTPDLNFEPRGDNLRGTMPLGREGHRGYRSRPSVRSVGGRGLAVDFRSCMIVLAHH